MVLWYKNSHEFNYDFQTVSLAYFNRYPNPFASHVLSTDLIKIKIDSEGNLHQTKLIAKTGRLPKWCKPFLGKVNQTWIIEQTIVNPILKEMKTYTRNLDHTGIIRIEEYTTFNYSELENVTRSETYVKFSSGFRGFGIKDRIESWSHSKFDENLKKSRKGLSFVMDRFKHQKTALWETK
ncbi:hypothetical protein PACTADRAFT_47443 [Pachysolen tannophilus NRRL Y-2460]|uniref:PRELI/MSF1 domain-containing protein n=1 Tax=Pachysolen tannophilus NRRL Y-2460 TaxID=669874 RepID=A0A1E4U0L8_PACTA|nr:hypothetical protein PACTADRAFT_47443 [Pachysolen tannophilus NRRL Y-2460]